MSSMEKLNKNLDNFKLIRELQDKFGEFRGETVLQLFKRYQKIKSPQLSSDILKYSSYNKKWKGYFLKEKKLLQGSFTNNQFSAIEHIGSTSIINQSSNNIIDIALIVKPGNITQFHAILTNLGYEYYGNSPLSKDANWFWKVQKENYYTYVIHLDNENNLWLSDTINFRDYLSLFDEERNNYTRMKSKIAKLKKKDMLTYSLLKLEQTFEIQEKALKWRMDATD